MSPPEPRLSDIQAWLHTFVVHSGTEGEALEAAEKKAGFAKGSAESLILPSPTLNPAERIRIYRSMYLLRMGEALAIDFPAVRDRVGEDTFEEFVSSYVEQFPSQSYTLDHLGREFANFLANRDLKDSLFLSELATLEWALCVVDIAENSPVLEMADLASVSPENFTQLVFQTIEAFQFLNLSHNTNQVFRTWSQDQVWEETKSEASGVVVWRPQTEVWRLEIPQGAQAFLSHLLEGRCLGEALDLAIESEGETEESLFSFFQNWVNEGFFSSFHCQN